MNRSNRRSHGRHGRKALHPKYLGIVLATLIAVGAVVAGLTRSRAAGAEELDPDVIPPDPRGLNVEAKRLMVVVSDLPPEQRPKSHMLRYRGFDVSFNPELHVPNYVAWELTGAEAQGSEPRHDRFAPDERVDGSAHPDDYRYSGYDRGHMAPAGDMKWDSQAMQESFLMTNICPQSHKLNTGAWSSTEKKCRLRAVTDSAVIVICGPVFGPGGPQAHIGGTGVAVPDAFFKVVLSPFREPPVGIGFVMPNGDAPGGMQPYAVSIDAVEELTGYDFFSALPDDVEAAVESQCNFQKWSAGR